MTKLQENPDDASYRLVSVDAVRAPEGQSGSDWHVYRIAQGENDIAGYRRGNIARVTAEAEAIVIALNGRRQWSSSKAASKSPRRGAVSAARADVK